MVVVKNGHTFRIEVQMWDVSSNHRADPRWRYVDKAGHPHQWHDSNGQVMTTYNPRVTYTVPTLVVVLEEPYWCADCHDEHQDSHYECRECREVIEPGYKADDTRQFIPGLKTPYIDDVEVSKEEFERRLAE